MGFIDCKEHEITSNETWNFGYDNFKYTKDALQEYLKPGEFIEVDRLGRNSPGNLEDSVKRLKELGLDIGNENQEFGYDICPKNQNPNIIGRFCVFRRRN